MLRAERFFRLILLAYPREFRREFGPEMAQVFRDCYRAEEKHSGLIGIGRLWLNIFIDLARTAPKQHLERLGKENSIMKDLRRDVIAVLGSIGIIVIAFLLLSYGRKHDVPSILVFGFALDALVSAGIVGNLIVFLLVKTTRLNPLGTALWTFLLVNFVLALVSVLVGSRVDPQFRLGSLVIAYVVSFLFWFGLHWIWSKSKGQLVSG
jgi:hypothetical protein